MGTHCPLVVTIFLFRLVYHSVQATTNINNINGGFSAHLIRKNSPYSPWYKHHMRTDETSGEHIMKFSMGTPPIDIYAIADTGRDLLWTQGQPCFLCYMSKHALFDRRKSSTFRNITCGARECRLVAERKPANYPPNYCSEDHEKPCVYHYSYADESYSEGLLVKETITMTSTTGEVVALEDIIVGCGIKNDVGHNSATRNEMGMIGFGRGPLSFVSQIAPYVGGNRFSHCLVPASTDPIIESKIYFGNGSEVLGEGVVSTPLVDTKEFSNNYIVIAEGITVGNEFVSFNSSEETMDMKYKMWKTLRRIIMDSLEAIFREICWLGLTWIKKWHPSSQLIA